MENPFGNTFLKLRHGDGSSLLLYQSKNVKNKVILNLLKDKYFFFVK